MTGQQQHATAHGKTHRHSWSEVPREAQLQVISVGRGDHHLLCSRLTLTAWATANIQGNVDNAAVSYIHMQGSMQGNVYTAAVHSLQSQATWRRGCCSRCQTTRQHVVVLPAWQAWIGRSRRADKMRGNSLNWGHSRHWNYRHHRHGHRHRYHRHRHWHRHACPIHGFQHEGFALVASAKRTKAA